MIFTYKLFNEYQKMIFLGIYNKNKNEDHEIMLKKLFPLIFILKR